MAPANDWVLQSASFFWMCTVLLSESDSRQQTQTYYMEGVDCGHTKTMGAAVVYSQLVTTGQLYPHDAECRITFRAEQAGWRLMVRVLELDIPDRTVNGFCNDALYIYDDATILAKALEEAGGTGGLCGDLLPATLYSTGHHLTVVFKTDSDGPVGRGFKFTVVAFSEDYDKYGTCGSMFQCANKKCIELALVCDGVDNCGDFSDEAAEGRSQCHPECGFICKFLSLGVTAAIFISVGGVVTLVCCVLAVLCCCRRHMCRHRAPDTQSTATTLTPTNTTTTTTTTTTTSSGLSNGSPACNVPGDTEGCQAANAFSSHGYSLPGYQPLQPVAPVVHSDTVHTKDPFPPTGSAYSSSQPSQNRSCTPPSSKSGQSGQSTRSNNSTSITFSHGTEKVLMPVNL